MKVQSGIFIDKASTILANRVLNFQCQAQVALEDRSENVFKGRFRFFKARKLLTNFSAVFAVFVLIVTQI